MLLSKAILLNLIHAFTNGEFSDFLSVLFMMFGSSFSAHFFLMSYLFPFNASAMDDDYK